MANNKTSAFVTNDNFSGAGCKTVAPTTAYTVLSDDNYVQCGGALTVTLGVNSNSPVIIDSNGNVVVITDGTRDYDIGDTDQAVAVECKRIGASNDWIVLGAALS